MKRSIILITVLFALLSCGKGKVVWEDPIIGYSQQNNISISKVVITDEKTEVHMNIHYPSMSWFRFAKETYIDADGKRYAAIGSDSIILGEETYTDSETWRKNFILYFEPLPKKTKLFDLLEGTNKGDYKFFNIRPQEEKLLEAEIPADFLADKPEEDVWPEMAYSEEPVTIHFKALNYKPGMNSQISIWHFNITNPTARMREENIYLNEDGTAEYTTKIYYPQHVQVTFDASASTRYSSFANPFLAPGEEITILMDMNVVADTVKNNFIGFKGYMAGFNKRYLQNSRRDYPRIEIESIGNAKTVAEIIKIHDSFMNVIKEFYDRKNTSDFDRKHLFLYELRFFNWVAEYADSLFRTKEFLDYIIRIRPACFFDDSYLEANQDYRYVCHLFVDTDVRGKGPDFCRFLYGVAQVRDGRKIKKPFIEDPDLSNLYDRLSGDINIEIDKNKKRTFAGNVHYLDLADVAPENIQQAILDKYKGKTVVFDLWATWCGWCIKGHQEMTSLKEKLKEKNIVFVYLTSISSPFDQWMHYTTEVSGEHYYLTTEQDNYISEHMFGSAGVPKYAIFDTQGKLLYKQLGWEGLERIQTEIEKALK